MKLRKPPKIMYKFSYRFVGYTSLDAYLVTPKTGKIHRVETRKIRVEVSLRQKTSQVSLSLVAIATRLRY